MLTEPERAALHELHGDLEDLRVRVRREGGDALRAIVLFLSRGRAVALGRHVFVPGGQERDVAVLAHELMHCRQYAEWGPLRYYARGFAEQARHLLSRAGLARNPYDWRSVPRQSFEAYGMEQHGQIVEDACRGDPAAREIIGRPPLPGAGVHRTAARPSDSPSPEEF